VDPSYANAEPSQVQRALLEREHTPVHEFVFKLARLKDGMLTASGKRLARERHEFMVAFFERLEQEVHGTC